LVVGTVCGTGIGSVRTGGISIRWTNTEGLVEHADLGRIAVARERASRWIVPSKEVHEGLPCKRQLPSPIEVLCDSAWILDELIDTLCDRGSSSAEHY
jgi:hypothetical protein